MASTNSKSSEEKSSVNLGKIAFAGDIGSEEESWKGEKMSGGKYLVMSNGEQGVYAVVFNETESHDKMAQKLGGREFVLGAGQVSVGETSDGRYATCFGKSVTLGVKSRGREDAFFVSFAVFGTTSDVDLGV